MGDIDCGAEMTKFHDQMVTLPLREQQSMRSRREAGRIRLRNGLDTAEQPQPKEVESQGSYQMRTMVQDADNDYDIDDGAYFRYDDLTDGNGLALLPLSARKRVCEALTWDGRLKKKAEVKDNCVRQYYHEGHHIDVPVYRIVAEHDANGNVTETYELASGDRWVISDARAVTRWFNGIVGELNQGQSDGSQLRRVVKLTKKFARRSEWKELTTSGITISKLVKDHFSANVDRDDKAIRDTWQKISSSLATSSEVKHPVLDQNLAEAGDAKVRHFKDCLDAALNELQKLDEDGVDRPAVREVWDTVFDTDFFSDLPDPDADDSSTPNTIVSTTTAETARRNDGGGRFG